MAFSVKFSLYLVIHLHLSLLVEASLFCLLLPNFKLLGANLGYASVICEASTKANRLPPNFFI